jgi:hypothetical protein
MASSEQVKEQVVEWRQLNRVATPEQSVSDFNHLAKRLRRHVAEAVTDYNMISDGAKILMPCSTFC